MAKAIKKQALGRGLSALLQDSKEEKRSEGVENNASKAGSIIELELELIEVNPFQPRTQFKEDAIRELASSIQELGVIQPITVRHGELHLHQHRRLRFRLLHLLVRQH